MLIFSTIRNITKLITLTFNGITSIKCQYFCMSNKQIKFLFINVLGQNHQESRRSPGLTKKRTNFIDNCGSYNCNCLLCDVLDLRLLNCWLTAVHWYFSNVQNSHVDTSETNENAFKYSNK